MHHSFDLEAAILDILYQKCIERPLWVSDSEVYWLIPNMHVTERDVREVLERLVYHRRVLKQVGKYQISKAEFLSIKERIEGKEAQENGEQDTDEYTQGRGRKSKKETKGSASKCNMPSTYSYQRLWRIGLIALIGILLLSVAWSWYGNNTARSHYSEPTNLPIMEAGVRGNDLDEDLGLLYRHLQQSHGSDHQIDSLQQAIMRTQAYIIQQSWQIEEQVKLLRYWLIAGGLLLLYLLLARGRNNFFDGNRL